MSDVLHFLKNSDIILKTTLWRLIMKNPPFEITNTIIDLVAEIAELVGKLTSINQLSTNPTLRRTNRIRTIHGSLAIEQNTLSLEQVTAVLNGKRVLAPPKDIAEVKNAYEIYERLDELDPYSVDDLLTAPVDGSGYNDKYGLLGSNKSTEGSVKLFPIKCQEFVEEVQKELIEKTGKHIEVMIYGDGAFKDPVGKIWELADPVVSPAYTKGLEGTPNEVKLKYLADNNFAHLEGEELRKDLKIKFDELVNKVKEIDVKEVSEDLMKKVEELKKELEDLDKEKVLEIAKKKGEELKNKANELVELAKEKGTPILEKAADDVRQRAILVTKDVLKKLETSESK